MAYAPKTWTDGVTAFAAADGTRIEAGIVAVEAAQLWLPTIAVAANAYCLTDPLKTALSTVPAGNAGGQAMGYPWGLGRTIVVDSVLVNNASAGAAGTVSRFMIYKADSTGRPSALVWDSGQEAADATGLKTFTTSGSPTPGTATMTMLPGVYWTISIRATGVATAASYTSGTYSQPAWQSSTAFPAANNGTFDLGAATSTSVAPNPWTNTTFGVLSRNPLLLCLHVTAVS